MDVSPPLLIEEEPEWLKHIPILKYYVIFCLMLHIFELVLYYRQLKKLENQTTIPPQLCNVITKEELIKFNSYGRDKMLFSLFNSIFETIIWFLSTTLFLGPEFWRMSGNIVGYENEYLQSLCYAAFFAIMSEVLGTPWSLYYDFVLEEKHGFNKKTYGLFFGDKAKSLILTAVIGGPITCMVIWLIKWSGKTVHLWLEAGTIILTFVMMFIYPNFIAPLFNKFEELKDQNLKEKIENLAQSLNFPLTKLYQIDGSKRSSHSNAYFFGFWKSKRIVLYDTLLHLPHDRILAILGHELGHWKKSHTSKMMIFSFLQLFALFYIYGKVMNSTTLFNSFGYVDSRAAIIGLMLCSNIFTPISLVLGVISTLLSRKHEFEADAFASHLGYNSSLQKGLIDLHKENKSTIDPDEWYSWWHYSHPPLIERLKMLEKLSINEEGKKTQ